MPPGPLAVGLGAGLAVLELATAAITIVLVMRFGLFTLLVSMIYMTLLAGFVTTYYFAAWYRHGGALVLLALTAISIHAFRIALAGRRVFSASFLEEGAGSSRA